MFKRFDEITKDQVIEKFKQCVIVIGNEKPTNGFKVVTGEIIMYR